MGIVTRTARTVGVAVLCLVGVSACSASIADSEYDGVLPSDAITTPTAIPEDGEANLLDPYPSAGWLDDGDRFAIVLGGSSSCPSFPASMVVEDSHTLSIEIGQSGGPMCTADMKLRTHVLTTPSGMDTTSEITIRYGESGTAVLPAL
ncbi:hypothetical protein [Cryobacterium arcticum]|uniref:Lipoprotein n=1 Tax=Cryobacterium arcticum TaxID=670052 RepID=A0A1B1BQ42_9MICO|nr:hypothetical protein [Cryobacterium arcticum]ANP74655.1 hypothetical protein PA27867_3738 [Cryobacterium arcticum]